MTKNQLDPSPSQPQQITEEEKSAANLGLFLYHQGRLSESRDIYESILAKNPCHFDALQMLGTIALQTKNTDKAMDFLRLALEVNQSSHHAFNSYGIALGRNKQYIEAIENYDRAIVLRSDFAEAYNNRANALLEIKSYDAAIASLEKAIALKPNYAEAYCNYGITLVGVEQYEKAITSYEKAIEIKPSYAEAYFHYGIVLAKVEQYAQAIASYEKAIEIKADYPAAYFNKGIALAKIECYDNAIASYEKAIELKPDFAAAHLNLSLILLMQGQFVRGWNEYEWRDKTAHNKETLKPSNRSLWTGEQNLAGKTILIYSEQGLGDTIQFSRYIRLLSKLGAKILLDVQQSLVELLKSLNSDAEISSIPVGSTISNFDYHCPLLSLPRAFKTDIQTIYAPKSYLQAPSGQIEKWSAKVGEKVKPRIGIAWSSTSGFSYDAQRSVKLADFLTALPKEGFEYFCLQKEIKPEDEETLLQHPQIKFFGQHLDDFSDTAALIDSVDLVISTCTSIPHLSGALGKPTWLMLQNYADWRWLLNRTDSPWYPSIKIYRQASQGDWNSVFRVIKSDLLKIIK